MITGFLIEPNATQGKCIFYVKCFTMLLIFFKVHNNDKVLHVLRKRQVCDNV